jgi:hypothetical protein
LEDDWPSLSALPTCHLSHANASRRHIAKKTTQAYLVTASKGAIMANALQINTKLGKVSKTLKKELGERFKPVQILDLSVEKSVGYDGDDLLLVRVVFDKEPHKLDAMKLVGNVRHFRPVLEKLGERAFPLFSYFNKEDWDEWRRESA